MAYQEHETGLLVDQDGFAEGELPEALGDETIPPDGADKNPRDAKGNGTTEAPEPSAGQAAKAEDGPRPGTSKSDILFRRITDGVHNLLTELEEVRRRISDKGLSVVDAGTHLQSRTQLCPDTLNDMRRILSYLDQLFGALPQEKIEQFVRSKCFILYRKVFQQLGLVGTRNAFTLEG
jgi:hypothetical protein